MFSIYKARTAYTARGADKNMSKTVQELKMELQKLRERRVIDADAVDRARIRTRGRLTDPSNLNFAVSLATDLEKLDKRIAEIEAEIEKAKGEDED